MSLAIVYSRASMGVQAPLVTIEVHLSNGKPGFTLVGLPEKTVKKRKIVSECINEPPSSNILLNASPSILHRPIYPKKGGDLIYLLQSVF